MFNIFLNYLWFSVEKFDSEESQLAKQAQKAANIKKKQLTALLAKPIFPKGFGTKYPIFNSELHIPSLEDPAKEEKAIDVMRVAMEELSKTKIRRVPLYKPRKKLDNRLQNDTMKLKKFKLGMVQKRTKNSKKFKRK